ncbi:50S ribosomal protein L25 [Patescibacteria group bacterium]|nr:MAG: 50S ribosomal protein L25 [Patescibacteria group bacterium]
MSSDKIAVELEPREQLGKGLATLRSTGVVPAVIHNHGKASIHVQGGDRELSKVFEAAGKHHPVQVTVGGKQHLALIKDVDFEPTKRRMRHVVFQAIKQNEAVEAEVPVVFSEDAEVPAEKKSLLVLKQLDHVEIKALPKDLPDELVVDPSTLAEVGDSLSVADLSVPSGVTVLTDPETQIAIVEMPKDQIAEADAAAAALAEDADKPADEAPAGSSDETAPESSEEKSE